ncbi:MAG: hypothetical protein U1E37_09685 [Sphingomonadaceae bacterium]
MLSLSKHRPDLRAVSRGIKNKGSPSTGSGRTNLVAAAGTALFVIASAAKQSTAVCASVLVIASVAKQSSAVVAAVDCRAATPLAMTELGTKPPCPFVLSLSKHRPDLRAVSRGIRNKGSPSTGSGRTDLVAAAGTAVFVIASVAKQSSAVGATLDCRAAVPLAMT